MPVREPRPSPPEDGGPWAAYRPSDATPWDLRRVVHLHRRAGFAANWDQLRQALEDGPEASIGRILDGTAHSSNIPEGFERTAEALAEDAVAAKDPRRLKGWWLYRMLFSPDPLGERLTLMWHDHFATSNAKVDELAAMRRQNDLFREHARAPFGRLLNAAVHDPALLIWLDAPDNRREHPNENLARELMELFTLGVGNYTEDDVKDAARALTGWTVKEGSFREVAARQDAGEKTILGRPGRWGGDDLVKILLAHPATADRLAWRICGLLMGEGAVGRDGLDALALHLREHDLDVGRAVATVLRSRAFFADSNLGTRVLGPAEYVVGAGRALELLDPPPGTLALADWLTKLGQDLFYPPNVGGWPGGRAWLTSQAVVGRANFAGALLGGVRLGLPRPADPSALATRHGRVGGREAILDFYAELLLGAVPGPTWRRRVGEALGAEAVANGPDSARRILAWILASPEAQMA